MQSVLPRKSYSLDEFARQNAIGLTTVRGEIKAGRLAARKVGRRTIITAEDAKAWQERLPKVQPRVRVASIESVATSNKPKQCPARESGKKEKSR
jgi:hypothetical protein